MPCTWYVSLKPSMSVFQLHGAGTDTAAVQRNSSSRAHAQSSGTSPEEFGERLGVEGEVDEHERAPGVDPHGDQPGFLGSSSPRAPNSRRDGTSRSRPARSYVQRWNGQRISVEARARCPRTARSPGAGTRSGTRAARRRRPARASTDSGPTRSSWKSPGFATWSSEHAQLPHPRPQPFVLEGGERARRVARRGNGDRPRDGSWSTDRGEPLPMARVPVERLLNVRERRGRFPDRQTCTMSVRFGPSSDPGETECGCVGASSRRLWCSCVTACGGGSSGDGTARWRSGRFDDHGDRRRPTACNDRDAHEPRDRRDREDDHRHGHRRRRTTAIRPGLFKGSWDGVKAWGDYINAKGGLACRKVVVKDGDSKLSPTDAKNAVAAACSNSIAMVGTTALFLQDVTAMESCKDKAGAGDGHPRHRRAPDRGRAAVLEDLVRDAADRLVVPLQRHGRAHVPRRLHAVRLLLQQVRRERAARRVRRSRRTFRRRSRRRCRSSAPRTRWASRATPSSARAAPRSRPTTRRSRRR